MEPGTTFWLVFWPELGQPPANLLTNMKVYIVFRQAPERSSSGNEFIGVFFDRTSAEVFIAERPIPELYFIETYEKPVAGKKHEVFA